MTGKPYLSLALSFLMYKMHAVKDKYIDIGRVSMFISSMWHMKLLTISSQNFDLIISISETNVA